MSRNGSGVYSATVTGGAYPASSGTLIEATKFNTLIADVETAMTQSVSKDGQTAMTGNLPMGSNKVTGMANGSSATDAANVSQVQSGVVQWCGTAGGTADALTLTPAPALAAYAAGVTLKFKSGASPNTGAATVNVSSIGAIAIQLNGAALAAGDIEADQWYQIVLSDASTAQLSKIGNIDTFTSPAFTGTPTAPTAAEDTNTTQLATTAFVLAQAASQAEMEAASSTTQFATAGNTNWHPGVAKCWAKVTWSAGTPSVQASHNITDVTDVGPGIVAVNIATDFSSANYAVISQLLMATGDKERCFVDSVAAGSFEINIKNDSGDVDPDGIFAAAFGDQ